MTAPIWQPSAQRIAQSNMQRFLDAHADQLTTKDYAALYQWSIDKPAAFWEAFWDFCGIRATTPYDTVLSAPEQMPGARWFDGAELKLVKVSGRVYSTLDMARLLPTFEIFEDEGEAIRSFGNA